MPIRRHGASRRCRVRDASWPSTTAAVARNECLFMKSLAAVHCDHPTQKGLQWTTLPSVADWAEQRAKRLTLNRP